VTWTTRLACLTLLLLGPAWLRQVHACAMHTDSHATTCSDHDHHHADPPGGDRPTPTHDEHGCLQCDALQAMAGMTPHVVGTLVPMTTFGMVSSAQAAAPPRPRPWRATLAQPPPRG
jgi:hypothetical protein